MPKEVHLHLTTFKMIMLQHRYVFALFSSESGYFETAFYIYFFFSLTIARAQDTIVWEAGYKLKLSDFQSPSSKIGGDTYRLETGSQIDFHYHLSEAEFKKIKNFNPKVHCKFKRS